MSEQRWSNDKLLAAYDVAAAMVGWDMTCSDVVARAVAHGVAIGRADATLVPRLFPGVTERLHFARRVREALGVDAPAYKRLEWRDKPSVGLSHSHAGVGGFRLRAYDDGSWGMDSLAGNAPDEIETSNDVIADTLDAAKGSTLPVLNAPAQGDDYRQYLADIERLTAEVARLTAELEAAKGEGAKVGLACALTESALGAARTEIATLRARIEAGIAAASANMPRCRRVVRHGRGYPLDAAPRPANGARLMTDRGNDRPTAILEEGARVGRWILVERVGGFWRCRCDCHAAPLALVRASSLAQGSGRGCSLHRGSGRRQDSTPTPRNAEIVRKRRAGAMLPDIARQHGISKQRVAEICKRWSDWRQE